MAFVDGQQVGDELAGHSQGGAVAMAALQFAGVERGQLRIPGGWPTLPVDFDLSSLTRIPDAPFFAKQQGGNHTACTTTKHHQKAGGAGF